MLDLIGYGIRISLDHPVQLGRLAPEHAPAADTIILARPGGEGQKVLVVPGETSHAGGFQPKKLQEEGLEGWVLQQADDGTRVVLGESKELGDIASVSEGPKTRRWELETTKGYAGQWLEGFNVLTTDEQTTWPYELIGHDGSLAYVRGPMAPDQIPQPEQLAVQDQELLRDETDANPPWVELGYDHDDQQWRLSYHFVTLQDRATLAVCVQASANGAEPAQQRGANFAQSLRLID